MKILLVANGYPPTAVGGVEVYTAGLAQALQSRGHIVSVLCVESKPDEADYNVSEEHPDGIKLFRLVNNYKKIEGFADTFANARIDEIFSRLLDRLQPDLVHFNHLIAMSARLPSIASQARIPSLFTAHDFWALCQRIYLQDSLDRACPGPGCGGNCYTCITAPTPVRHARTVTISAIRNWIPFRLRALLRGLLAKGDNLLPQFVATPEAFDLRYRLFRDAIESTGRLVVPSQFVKQMFVDNGYRESHIHVLPLGLSESARQAPVMVCSNKPMRFAFVGAVAPWKGTETLVKAFMRTPRPDVRLTIYGREDVIPSFARSLRRLAADDRRITFAGPFPPANKDAIYKEIDVLVIPSMAYESFSFVAREALLRGVPVIAADIGALPEVIKDGVNGFLTPPGDAQALSALLARLADQPELLARLQLPGPVPILSVEQHIEHLLQIYDECRALPS